MYIPKCNCTKNNPERSEPEKFFVHFFSKKWAGLRGSSPLVGFLRATALKLGDDVVDKWKAKLKNKLKSAWKYIETFVKWVMIGSFTGEIGGLVGTLFSTTLQHANHISQSISYLIFFMPLGGIVICGLYKMCELETDPGTNIILESVRTKKHIPWIIAPLIFFSTAMTHLLGGSAGREGAALQLGGSLGYVVGRVTRLDEKDMHLSVMCGMSGLFSALFGTPVTACVFAIEVISVGVSYYSALVPCLISAVVSYGVALSFGVTPMHFDITQHIPQVDFISLSQVIVLSGLCAIVSIVFCILMHKTPKLMKKFLKNDYLRAFAGGMIIIVLTLLVNCRDYNGAGSEIIAKALNGEVKTEAFLLKMIFTAVTIGCGYKGGEIVPTLFIGSTFGCMMGNLLGLSPVFGAGIGMICLFCGVVNCPFASLMLSVELFGSQGVILFATGCVVSYMLSGYYGLYSSQKILYSKLKAEFININAK